MVDGNIRLIPIPVSEFPESASLDGAFSIGVDRTGKSVKFAMETLKGNKGDQGVPGKDGDVTAAMLAEALRSANFLASDNSNGLMSAEQVKQLNEITEYMKPIEERYDSAALIQFKNTDPAVYSDAIIFESATDTAHIEIDGFLMKIKVAVGWNKWPVNLYKPNGYVKLYWNSLGSGGLLGTDIPNVTDKIQVASSALKFLTLNRGQYTIIDAAAASGLKEFQSWFNDRLIGLDLSKNLQLNTVFVPGSQSLTSISLYGKNMAKGYFQACGKLSVLSFTAEALNEMIELNISSTAITKAVLLAIEAKWTSRVGKSAGVLTLNEALFNELSTAEKSLFINKNITFNIA